MGLEALGAKLRKDLKGQCVEYLSPGMTLLVDGRSFLLYVMSDPIRKLYKSSLKQQLRGSYAKLEEIIKKEITRLTNFLSLNLIFYFGNEESYFKEETNSSLAQEILDQWSKFEESINENTNIYPQKEMPQSPLSLTQLISTCIEMKIPVVQGEGEVEQLLAVDCHKMNQKSGYTSAFVYSSNGDFLLMRDCPFIFIDSLSTANLTRKQKNSKRDPLQVMVFRRNITALTLGFSEEIFLEFGFLCGDSFTKFYERKSFGSIGKYKDFPEDSSYASIDNLQLIMRETKEKFKLKPKDINLQKVLEYSRKFYNLQNVKSYQVTENETIPINFEVGEKNSIIELNSQQKEFLYSYPINSRTLKPNFEEENLNKKFENYVDVTNTVLKLLQEDNCVSFSEGKQLPQLFPTVKMFHLEVLDEMKKILMSKKKNIKDSKVLMNLLWEDICAAQTYQIVIKQVYENLKGPSEVLPCLPPKYLFDGTIFFRLMSEFRLKDNNINSNSSSFKATPPSINMETMEKINSQVLEKVDIRNEKINNGEIKPLISEKELIVNDKKDEVKKEQVEVEVEKIIEKDLTADTTPLPTFNKLLQGWKSKEIETPPTRMTPPFLKHNLTTKTGYQLPQNMNSKISSKNSENGILESGNVEEDDNLSDNHSEITQTTNASTIPANYGSINSMSEDYKIQKNTSMELRNSEKEEEKEEQSVCCSFWCC